MMDFVWVEYKKISESFWNGNESLPLIILVKAINFQNFKIQPMSSVEHYRLALQQQILYQQQIQECIAVQQEIEDLKARIAAKHKKHRRCDKEILKDFQCLACEKRYASDIALKLHLKLKHPKSGEEKGWACSTSQSHYVIEHSTPEHQTQGNIVS